MIQTFPGSGSGEDNPHQRRVPTLAGHLKQNHPFAGADFYRCRVELEGSLSAPPAASSSKHGHSSVEWLWGSFLQAHARFCLFSHPNNSKETCSKVCILLRRKLNSSEKKTKQLYQMTQNHSKADLAKRKQILGLLDSNLVILTSDSLVGVFVVPPPPPPRLCPGLTTFTQAGLCLNIRKTYPDLVATNPLFPTSLLFPALAPVFFIALTTWRVTYLCVDCMGTPTRTQSLWDRNFFHFSIPAPETNFGTWSEINTCYIKEWLLSND